MLERAHVVPRPWIQSPLWDGVWMFSGLWLPLLSMALYGLLSSFSEAPARLDMLGYSIESLALVYLPLSVLHRISTTYAVLGTPILRDDIRRDPKRYLYVPLAILVGCIALAQGFAFHSHFAFMPSLHGQLWAFFLLAYVMILWERWHFCAQEFGVLSIYRMRSKQAAPNDKRFDRFYTVALMLGVNMVLFIALGYPDEKSVLMYGTPIAALATDAMKPVATTAFAIGMLIMVVALVRELRHPQRSWPKLAFYVLIAAHTFFSYVFPHAIGLFFLSYAVHHWMVAVGLFSRVTLRSYGQAPILGRIGRMMLRVGPWLALTVLIYLVFDPLDKAGSLTPLPDARMFEGASTGAKVSAGLIVGCFFALNYLHYYYDRCLYAFSHKAVRENVAPLLF